MNTILPVFLDILFNDSGNQSDCNIAFFINSCDNEADFILFAGHTVIIAAVGYGIDSDMETYKDRTFMDVSNDTGIFALNLAFAQVCFAGVAVYTFDICFYGNVLQ